jgi:hypothetical protein
MTFLSSKIYASAFFCVVLALPVVGQSQVDNPGQTAMKDAASALQSGPAGQQHVDNPGQTSAPAAAPVGEAVVTGNGISFHGGTVMKANPVPFYLIWYGNWNGAGSNTPATKTLVEHFVSTLGGTPYEQIATTYGDNTGNASGNVSLGGSIIVFSSTNLTDSSVQSTVGNALSSGALPTDPNGIYFVISSSNIAESSGFCTTYCGFHTHATLHGADIKYAFVGNPDRCRSACEVQATGPNSPSVGNGGADGIVFQLAGRQFDTIADPDLNAWFDGSNQEPVEKCTGMLGPLITCSAGSGCTNAGITGGAKHNVCFGGMCWLLPEVWENANGGRCTLQK